MVQGRINKYYKDIVITEQEFVKNSDVTVGTYLKNNNSYAKLFSYSTEWSGPNYETRCYTSYKISNDKKILFLCFFSFFC